MEQSNKLDIKKLQRYYKLKNLVRYNQMSRTTNESVAEHTYYVVLFTKMICDELKVDDKIKIKAIDYAIIHDLPEIYTSDIPHPVKSRNPQLDKVLNEVEIDCMQNHMPMYRQAYEEGISRVDDRVSTIVDLADILSVIQYANSQVKLGNTYFQDVFESGLMRYNSCKIHLCEVFGVEDFKLFERSE